jgi:predicted ABC-type transport system involved in lysophospholipase L1 biosynthesis ATPase subunit
MMTDFKYVLRMLAVRAIFYNPKLILADEPTGNPHSGQGEEIRESGQMIFESKLDPSSVFLPKTFGRTLALPSGLNIGAGAVSSIRQQN